jgi:hypothetical protein
VGRDASATSWLSWLLPVNGLLVAAEVWGRHPTEDAARAARLLHEDPRFSSGVLAVGHLAPLAVLWARPDAAWAAFAGGLALAGLLIWEHLYLQAPQRIPNA